MMTWLIAADGFMHIVAGGVDAFMLILHGDAGWLQMLASFGLPALIGDIIGGTALFALIAYARVMKEISKSGAPVHTALARRMKSLTLSLS